MADMLYTNFKKYTVNGTIDLDSDTFYIALLSSSYSPSASNDTFSDVSSYEITGTGYTAGGIALTGVTLNVSGTEVIWTATNPVWTNVTFTARYAVIYKSGTTNSITNPLVCCYDFTTDQTVTSNNFQINFNTSGIININ